MIQIINKQCRSKLCEGRSYQMGFAFLKKLDNNTFETVQPISPCKDYLNDVIFLKILAILGLLIAHSQANISYLVFINFTD